MVPWHTQLVCVLIEKTAVVKRRLLRFTVASIDLRLQTARFEDCRRSHSFGNVLVDDGCYLPLQPRRRPCGELQIVGDWEASRD